jgi:hypothetical protein
MSKSASDADERVRTQVDRIRRLVLDRHGVADSTEDTGSHRPRIDDVSRLATVTAHWGISSAVPLFGPFIVYWRRVVRILLRWYINPIVEQQNRFNQAVVRALFDLQLENDELRAELARRQDRKILE